MLDNYIVCVKVLKLFQMQTGLDKTQEARSICEFLNEIFKTKTYYMTAIS